MSTCFNGASHIAQPGWLAYLDAAGLAEVDGLIQYYMDNATLLRNTFRGMGFEVHGGADAP